MMKSKLIASISLGLLAVSSAYSQTTNPPIFLATTADTAGAIGLRWESQSNLVYRIEYADAVSNQVAWRTLYEDFPSQGTNTIWKDAGSESIIPTVPHPNDTNSRFYRVVVTGTNASSQPQVGIISPAANSVLSDYVTVSIAVTSSLSVVSVRLFVDGQEAGRQLYPATNFVINTAQFGNGAHLLFAVAENMEGSESTLEATALTDNFTASPYHPVTFDNYIYDFRGSAVFLNPALGGTIKFKANFAAYSDWTLIISNLSAVAVRTVTGSGYNMTFVWNGTDDNNTTVGTNGYSATLVAAQGTPPAPAPGPDPGPPPSPEGAQAAATVNDGNGAETFFPRTPAEAVAVGSDVYYPPLPPMPPVRQDGKWYSWEEIFGPLLLIPVPVPKDYTSRSSAGAEGLGAPGPDAPAAAGAATNTLIPLRFAYNRGMVGFAA